MLRRASPLRVRGLGADLCFQGRITVEAIASDARLQETSTAHHCLQVGPGGCVAGQRVSAIVADVQRVEQFVLIAIARGILDPFHDGGDCRPLELSDRIVDDPTAGRKV